MMLKTKFYLFLAGCMLASATVVQGAGLVLLDFAIPTGEAEGWDIIDEILAEDECNYLDDEFTPCTIFSVTDRAGSDDDITLEILEVPFIGNTAPHLADPQVYDGLGVPIAALGDYQYRNPDTAGSSAPFRFSNIDPGTYHVTVFEGRTNDSNGQFAKLWVGDFNGSNEPGEPGEHDGQNTGDFAAGSATVTVEIAEGEHLWYRHLEDNSGGISGMIIRPDSADPFPVQGRGTLGSTAVSGTRGNQVFSEPGGDPVPGLGQSWYAVSNPASKDGIDAAIATNERVVPYFQAEGTTWWTGSNAVDVEGVPAYPAQVADADPFPLNGDVTNANNYTVKLAGQIKFDESGTYLFTDGIDDFTYMAIDIDGSGVAGDNEEEVLINDNGWTDFLSAGNGGAPIVEVDVEVANGGEWRDIEFLMAEGGGGDSGALYWDYKDGIAGNEDLFPFNQGDGIFEDDAAELLVPDTHLQSPTSPPQLLSGEVTGDIPSSPSGWEVDVNAADGTADTFALENPDSDIYTTIMNVDGAVIHINTIGDVAEGSSFKIIDADQTTGELTIATEGWSFDPATGSVVFGTASPCVVGSQGDLDGNGKVEFADFLVLSGNFGKEVSSHTEGDIDCNGKVEFADFLTLSGNFGKDVGGAESVPEPSAFGLLFLSGLALTSLRRRRSV